MKVSNNNRLQIVKLELGLDLLDFPASAAAFILMIALPALKPLHLPERLAFPFYYFNRYVQSQVDFDHLALAEETHLDAFYNSNFRHFNLFHITRSLFRGTPLQSCLTFQYRTEGAAISTRIAAGGLHQWKFFLSDACCDLYGLTFYVL